MTHDEFMSLFSVILINFYRSVFIKLSRVDQYQFLYNTNHLNRCWNPYCSNIELGKIDIVVDNWNNMVVVGYSDRFLVGQNCRQSVFDNNTCMERNKTCIHSHNSSFEMPMSPRKSL